MNFKKIIINTIALVALLTFSNCQNETIDLADDNAEVPDAVISQADESNEAEDFPASGWSAGQHG